MVQQSNIYSIGDKVMINPERIALIDVRERDKPSYIRVYTVTNITRANGAILYDIEGNHYNYRLVEEALEPLEPDTSSTHDSENNDPYDYVADDIPLTGNLNLHLDPLDQNMMKKFDKLAEKHVRHLEDDVRKEIREIVLEVLRENNLVG